jgi:hypothetical protein
VAEHAPRAVSVAARDFIRLPEYFSDALLRDIQVVTVRRIPFPPVATLGLPEFGAMEQMGMTGITFGGVCFVHEAFASESNQFHELIHAVQWRALDPDDYLLTYGACLLQYGYARSPLEVTAYDLQSQFDRGYRIDGVEATVRAQAIRAREAAAELFLRHGVPMGV